MFSSFFVSHFLSRSKTFLLCIAIALLASCTEGQLEISSKSDDQVAQAFPAKYYDAMSAMVHGFRSQDYSERAARYVEKAKQEIEIDKRNPDLAKMPPEYISIPENICGIHYNSKEEKIYIYDSCELKSEPLTSLQYAVSGFQDWLIDFGGDEPSVYAFNEGVPVYVMLRVVGKYMRDDCSDLVREEYEGMGVNVDVQVDNFCFKSKPITN